MATEHSHVYATPLGPALIVESDGAITRVEVGALPTGPDQPSSLTNAFASELLEYLAGKRTVFSAEAHPKGSTFEQAVWDAIQQIPYGQTRTASDIACAIGQAKAHRQVGRAVAACPCPIIVPVHRVTSAHDALSERLRALEAQ